MSTTEQRNLEFRGEDADECEKFIASVMKYAFAQGKQRDDAWMADFAATCMAKDALRWWGHLEEDVQQSWKLLQKEMLSAYPPMFYGSSGKEAEKFVQLVYRRARDARKQNDNEWIVDFVQMCLAGDALRWYAGLESEVQDDWKQLRQAILTQWPADGDKVSTNWTSSILPTPPPAAPPVFAPLSKLDFATPQRTGAGRGRSTTGNDPTPDHSTRVGRRLSARVTDLFRPAPARPPPPPQSLWPEEAISGAGLDANDIEMVMNQ
ncbi:hypothetical protein FRC01_004062, partial [Tulasnella sp. 417]